MFQVKNFISIVASMVNRMRTTTTAFSDYNVGGVARTLVEAPAQEIDELYQQMLHGLVEAIPVSVYLTFNFPLLPPIAGSTLLLFTITSSAQDTLIAAGIVFTTPGSPVTFVSTADVIIASGSTTGNVPVAATTAGTVGNLASDAAFTPAPQTSTFVSATNLAAIINGQDQETADQRKLRFGRYIQALARGTLAAVEYGLSTTSLVDANGNVIERVQFAQVVEPFVTDSSQPVALINYYIHNGVGSTSDALLARAVVILAGYVDDGGNKVPGWKAAGVKAIGFKATETAVAVTGVLTTADGFDPNSLVAQVRTIIFTYLIGIPLDAPYIHAELYALIMAVPGVLNWVPSAPTADIAATSGVKLMPGTITVTHT